MPWFKLLFLDILIMEDETTVLACNFGNEWPSDMALYLIGTSTLLLTCYFVFWNFLLSWVTSAAGALLLNKLWVIILSFPCTGLSFSCIPLESSPSEHSSETIGASTSHEELNRRFEPGNWETGAQSKWSSRLWKRRGEGRHVFPSCCYRMISLTW